MAAFQPQLQLAHRLGIPQVPAGQFMITPLNSEVIVIGRAEPATQAIIEGVQILPEVAAGTVDRLAHDPPEVLQALDLAPLHDIGHGHQRRIASIARPNA